MIFPPDLKYTKEHEWVRIEGDVATVGITEFAQIELGDIVYVEIETEGQEMEEGDVFGTVEAVKTVSDLFMPMRGEVLEKNPELDANPEFVNKDPYGQGWIISLKVSDLSSVNSLLSSEEYRALVE